ncbi:hypothetical protein FCIRC_7386 [Fusarium circinatum]|uniref:Uncharacterized protein n=1 Tax=Fusarium circinatum TaxID=48490 RepID=A0A8H5TTQ1_FUSCI|nr:hypothetical protein FCIRC_7386 [Fusarium circinatum]
MSTREQPVVPRASLLGLPLELRQQIYHEYFTVDGGYAYNGDSGKLVQANNQPIELSLRYACRAIACETKQYPFSLNTITCSTLYRQDWRKQAASVDYITRHHVTFQHAMLARLKRLVTSEMYENPDPKYSQYLSAIKKDIAKAMARFDRHPNVPWDQNVFETLRASREGGSIRSMGMSQAVMSVSPRDGTIFFARAADYLLRQVAEKHPEDFSHAIEEILPGWTDSHSVADFFDLGFDPWAIPSVAEVKDKWEKLRLSFLWERLENWYQMPWKVDGYTSPEYRYKRKYRFSAASVAIRLLGHLSQQQRLSISKIILNEDRYAVGTPECHILGLIPFFQENPNLHIEHRVNLWRNIVPLSGYLNAEIISVEDQGDIQGDYDLPTMHQIYSSWPSEAITNIIMHTSQALKEGLPSRSYTLTFDGDPDLNHSTQFFSTIMKPHIAWLTANTDCVAQGLLLPQEHFNYPFDTRRSVEGICPEEGKTTILRCNFSLQQPWNYQEIVEDHDALSYQSLQSLMGSHFEPRIIDVSTDVIDWAKIKQESFHREEVPNAIDGESQV